MSCRLGIMLRSFAERESHLCALHKKTLVVIDVIFQGWMPWSRFGGPQDIAVYYAQVEEINAMKWDTLVTGHLARSGMHADVKLQLELRNSAISTCDR